MVEREREGFEVQTDYWRSLSGHTFLQLHGLGFYKLFCLGLGLGLGLELKDDDYFQRSDEICQRVGFVLDINECK